MYFILQLWNMKAKTKKLMAILWWFCIVSLAACWGTKEIDNGDVVSLNCKYTFVDGTTSNLNETVTIGEVSENDWISELVKWSLSWDIFTWIISSDILFPGMYNSNNTQTIPNIIMTEVIGLQEPKKWDQIFVDGFWDGYIMDEIIDEEWYKSYFVDFNDPKFYSDAEYEIQIVNVEKD